jgi:hypothetical protein
VKQRMGVFDWKRRRNKMRYGLLWLVGVPIPVLILIWFLFH